MVLDLGTNPDPSLVMSSGFGLMKVGLVGRVFLMQHDVDFLPVGIEQILMSLVHDAKGGFRGGQDCVRNRLPFSSKYCIIWWTLWWFWELLQLMVQCALKVSPHFLRKQSNGIYYLVSYKTASLAEEGRTRTLSWLRIRRWSVQQLAPRIARVISTSRRPERCTITKSIRCQCFECECIQEVLILFWSWNMVLVTQRENSEQISSKRRPLLLLLPTPCRPLTVCHTCWLAPTRALKSLSRTSL